MEKTEKINSEERIRLKEQFETKERGPNSGDAVENMRKVLKRLNIVDNREEIWKGKEHIRQNTIHNVQNGDYRSRYKRWQRYMNMRGYKRSDSRPEFWRNSARSQTSQCFIKDRFGSKFRSHS